MSGTQPSALSGAESRVLDVIQVHPGASSNEIVRLAGRLKQVVLRALAALAAESMIQATPGARGARHWFPAARKGLLGGSE